MNFLKEQWHKLEAEMRQAITPKIPPEVTRPTLMTLQVTPGLHWANLYQSDIKQAFLIFKGRNLALYNMGQHNCQDERVQNLCYPGFPYLPLTVMLSYCLKIKTQIQSGSIVVIYCNSSKLRSSTFFTVYLHFKLNLPLQETFLHIPQTLAGYMNQDICILQKRVSSKKGLSILNIEVIGLDEKNSYSVQLFDNLGFLKWTASLTKAEEGWHNCQFKQPVSLKDNFLVRVRDQAGQVLFKAFLNCNQLEPGRIEVSPAKLLKARSRTLGQIGLRMESKPWGENDLPSLYLQCLKRFGISSLQRIEIKKNQKMQEEADEYIAKLEKELEDG